MGTGWGDKGQAGPHFLHGNKMTQFCHLSPMNTGRCEAYTLPRSGPANIWRTGSLRCLVWALPGRPHHDPSPLF